MSKVTIVDLNPNDKEQVRNYMTKGERGYSAYELYVQNGGTLTEEEWLDAFLNADNYYNKSEVKGLVIDDLTSTVTDQPLSANQGKVLKGLVDNVYTKGDFAVVSFSVFNNGDDTSKQVTLNYPTGFTKDNCVVLSVMMRNASLESEPWGNGCVMTLNSTITGEILNSITLNEANITVYARNVYARAYSEATTPQIQEITLPPQINGKLVLMKIS